MLVAVVGSKALHGVLCLRFVAPAGQCLLRWHIVRSIWMRAYIPEPWSVSQQLCSLLLLLLLLHACVRTPF